MYEYNWTPEKKKRDRVKKITVNGVPDSHRKVTPKNTLIKH